MLSPDFVGARQLFWTIFTFPGRAIAWFAYMFPKRGDVWASARRVDSPMVHLLFSLMVYAGLGFAGFAMLNADRDSAAASSTTALMSVSTPASDATYEAYPPARPLYEEAPPPVSSEPMDDDYGDGDDRGATPSQPSFPTVDQPDAYAASDVVKPGKTAERPSKATTAYVDVQALSPDNTPALRAELVRLLESGPNERHGAWRVSGVQGELMVTPWRRTNGGVCRLYSFTARSADDMAASGYREACRTADGPWSLD